MEAISQNRSLRLQLVVTGTHLLRGFGYTIKDILRDGWRVDARVRMQAGDDSPLDQAEGLAHGVAGIARYLERAKTDIVVVLGDRIEAMAGALAGVTTGRLVAHIHGGDVAPGDFDDSLRHAITKLAHLHLTATQAARTRILRMGESPERVHRVGAPGLDRLVELVRERILTPAEVGARRDSRTSEHRSLTVAALNGRRALIVQHPCGRAAVVERRVMKAILGAVREVGLSATCIYPNSDRGHSGIIEAIETHRRRVGEHCFRVVRSLDHDTYLRLLINADVLVGNSSSGIIEAATAGTPAVNVGRRQLGREVSGESVIHAEETVAFIRKALQKALRMRPITGRRSVYGHGGAGRRIAELLAAVPLDDAFRRKVHNG
jgi:UDP-hydrolysing UDP-N-acetyl-D-glucosamine 2-epimerase